MAGSMGGGGFGGGSVTEPGTGGIGTGGIDNIISFDFFFDVIERLYNSVGGILADFDKPISELIGTLTDGTGLIDFLLEHLAVPLLQWLPILDRTPLELLFSSIPLVIVLTVIKSVR